VDAWPRNGPTNIWGWESRNALYSLYMDAIPLIILLIPYLLTLLLASVFLFFNVFHLWRYGVEGVGTSLLIVTYIGLFALTLGGTLLALGGFAWFGTFSLADLLPSSENSISSFGL
jgi:hypothetical protein